MLLNRRNTLKTLALAILGLAIGLPAQAKPDIKHVFIISFDGGKPAVMQQSQMPTLMQMRSEGTGTWEAFTVVPSITLVSHTSMLTGVQPDKHLIDWNSWKPEKGVVSVPTIFALAKKKGLTTSLFAGKEKFKHLNIPGSVDDFSIPGNDATTVVDAKTVAAAAAQCIVDKKPNLCFIHFADSDTTGHAFGWGSSEQIKAFSDEDAALLMIKEALQKAGIVDSSVVILTADHGGHAKTHGSTILEDMHIPWIAWGQGVKKGAPLKERISTCDTAATALWLLDVEVPKEFDGKPVKEAF